jgi:predicted lipase
MRNEPEVIRELHEIRARMSAETKDMTPEQRADRANAAAAEIAKQYGFEFSYQPYGQPNNQELVSA